MIFKKNSDLEERIVIAHERMADSLEELVELMKKEQLENVIDKRGFKRSWLR